MSTRRCGICFKQGHDRRNCPITKNASLLRTAIKSSSLSYFPTLHKKKVDIYDHIWGHEPCRYRNSIISQDDYEHKEIKLKLELLKEWTNTLYQDALDPVLPIAKFHLQLPLSFWVALFREVTSVIPKQYQKLMDQFNNISTRKNKKLTNFQYATVHWDITIPINDIIPKRYSTEWFIQKAAMDCLKLCVNMRKISNDCVNKMMPETKLTKKLIPEHIRHVMSYL